MASREMVKAQDKALDEVITAELIKRWLDYESKVNDKSENTVKAYERGLEVFCSWLGGQGLSLGFVTAREVAEFKVWLKENYSVQTTNLRLTSVRRFYAFVVQEGIAAVNPAREVPGIKRSGSHTHKRDALTGSEVLAVLDTCDTSMLEGLRDKVMLILLSYCGARQVELQRANIGDLRTKGDRLVLFVQGKGRQERDEYLIIPLSQEPVLLKWRAMRNRLEWAGVEPDAPLFVSFSNRTRGSRLGMSSIRNMVKRRFREAGVVDDNGVKSTHSLRHAFVTNAIRQAIKRGRSPLDVQRAARHKSMDTTLGYYHEVGRLDNPIEDVIDFSNGK